MKLAVFNTLVLRWCFWLLEMSLSVQSRLLPDQHTRMFSMCPKGTEFKAKHKVVKVGLRPFMSHGLVFPLANSNSSCFPLPPWAFLTFPPPTFAPRLSLTFHPSLPPSSPSPRPGSVQSITAAAFCKILKMSWVQLMGLSLPTVLLILACEYAWSGPVQGKLGGQQNQVLLLKRFNPSALIKDYWCFFCRPSLVSNVAENAAVRDNSRRVHPKGDCAPHLSSLVFLSCQYNSAISSSDHQGQRSRCSCLSPKPQTSSSDAVAAQADIMPSS